MLRMTSHPFHIFAATVCSETFNAFALMLLPSRFYSFGLYSRNFYNTLLSLQRIDVGESRVVVHTEKEVHHATQ